MGDLSCPRRLPGRLSDHYALLVEQAHGIRAWSSRPALAAELTINFGGNTMLQGELLMETTGGRSRIEMSDGTIMVFDGRDAWVSPADAGVGMARFHLRTWPYFIAAPMKLRDPGSTLTTLGPKQMEGRTYVTARLTFDAGVGDTPEDWYIAYADPLTHRLHGLAYVVTYGTPAQEAEKDPHYMSYESFKVIDGVTIATRLQSWSWSQEQGRHGDPLGEVTLSDIRFVTPAADAFDKPADARRDELP